MQGLILGTRDVNIPILGSQDSMFKSQERKNNIYWSRGYFKEIKGQGIWAMGKRALRKIFKILFLLETSKNDDFKFLFFPQNCPFSRNCPFIFQNFPLVFRSAFFLFAVHIFFQECFFSTWLYLLLLLTSPHREYLHSFCFVPSYTLY